MLNDIALATDMVIGEAVKMSKIGSGVYGAMALVDGVPAPAINIVVDIALATDAEC